MKFRAGWFASKVSANSDPACVERAASSGWAEDRQKQWLEHGGTGNIPVHDFPEPLLQETQMDLSAKRKLLLEAFRESSSESELHAAAVSGTPDEVRALADSGIDIDKPVDGTTPIFMALAV